MLSVSVSASAGWRSFLASSASRGNRQRALKQRIGRVDVQMHKAGFGVFRTVFCSSHPGSSQFRACPIARRTTPAIRGTARMGDPARRSPSPRWLPTAPHRNFHRWPARPHAAAQRTPNTCAHTANVARNRLIDVSAKASSATALTMTSLPEQRKNIVLFLFYRQEAVVGFVQWRRIRLMRAFGPRSLGVALGSQPVYTAGSLHPFVDLGFALEAFDISGFCARIFGEDLPIVLCYPLHFEGDFGVCSYRRICAVWPRPQALIGAAKGPTSQSPAVGPFEAC